MGIVVELELRLEAVVVVAVLAAVLQEAVYPVLTPECTWDPASTHQFSSLHVVLTYTPGEVLEDLDIKIRVSVQMELNTVQIDRNTVDMDLNASQRIFSTYALHVFGLACLPL